MKIDVPNSFIILDRPTTNPAENDREEPELALIEPELDSNPLDWMGIDIIHSFTRFKIPYILKSIMKQRLLVLPLKGVMTNRHIGSILDLLKNSFKRKSIMYLFDGKLMNIIYNILSLLYLS